MSDLTTTFEKIPVNEVFQDLMGNVWQKVELFYIEMGERQVPRNAYALRSTIAGVKVNWPGLFPNSMPVKTCSQDQFSKNTNHA